MDKRGIVHLSFGKLKVKAFLIPSKKKAWNISKSVTTLFLLKIPRKLLFIEELEATGNVAGYFNGHNHAGNYGFKNGIHYVNLKGMVETTDTNSYSIVRVFKDHIELGGFGQEPDHKLYFK